MKGSVSVICNRVTFIWGTWSHFELWFISANFPLHKFIPTFLMNPIATYPPLREEISNNFCTKTYSVERFISFTPFHMNPLGCYVRVLDISSPRTSSSCFHVIPYNLLPSSLIILPSYHSSWFSVRLLSMNWNKAFLMLPFPHFSFSLLLKTTYFFPFCW